MLFLLSEFVFVHFVILPLSRLKGLACWRTVSDIPSNEKVALFNNVILKGHAPGPIVKMLKNVRRKQLSAAN